MPSLHRASISVTPAVETNDAKEQNVDAHLLQGMGYSQELYRGFSPLMSFAFCFTAVNVLVSMSLGFTFTLHTGGSGVAIWSWLIGSVFTILIGLSLAEICSVYPSAGSVYHWAGQLVSARHAPLASYICGWFNLMGNVASNTAFASGFSSILDAALVLGGKPSLSLGVQVAISIGILSMWAIQNTFRIDQQGWLNNLAAFFQIASTITIFIVLFAMAPQRASAHDVFLSTYNGTGFPFPYVCCISILSTLFSFCGYEAGAHLAEETRDAGRAAPRGIFGTCICSAIVGLLYLLALLFSIPDIGVFLNSNSEENASTNFIIATYQLAAPGRGAIALTILLILNVYFAGMSSFTVATRIGFAMARDGVFPFSHYLRWIYNGTKTPLANVIFIFCIDSMLLLLQLLSTTAFSAIIAIATLGYQISYLIPIFFRFTSARKTFPLGEFNLGRFSLPIAFISSVWLAITSVFMFFPTEYPVTKDNMNYTIIVVGGVSFIAAMYWIFSARHWFVGPKRTDQHETPLSPGHVTAEDNVITEIPTDIALSKLQTSTFNT
ncbi:unnamed protein product [Rotaria socialis]|uniref:Amino acid transporter n=2 Tax=Rotaria socialis TaxID=392032 RepID=A0A820UEP3_9BILA|nr:unnamed protein product [Rotaria socialis]CAF4480437.1 unnamed protein product [Rotaria socialis]